MVVAAAIPRQYSRQMTTSRTPRSARSRRFALPQEHGSDDRAVEAIEAFIEGPSVRRHRPPVKRRARKGYPNTGSAQPPKQVAAVVVATEPDPRRGVAVHRPVDIRTLPGRLEFAAALERESLRAARYGRPACVAIVELVAERQNHQVDIWLRSLAGPVSRTLRQEARSTDLVARMASARFQVLLPETAETGAGRFAERISSACQTSIDATGAPIAVRVTVAVATPDHSLEEALVHALQSIEAA
jgi:GGDEF domain-containing protein